MSKYFTAGQKVKCVVRTGLALDHFKPGAVYTVERIREGDTDVYIEGVPHPQTGWWLAARFEAVEEPSTDDAPFVRGDKVTPVTFMTVGLTPGKPYMVANVDRSGGVGHWQVHFDADDGGSRRFRPADEFVRYEEPKNCARAYSAGDAVMLNMDYGRFAAATRGVVITTEPNGRHQQERDGDLVYVKTNGGAEFAAFAYRLDPAPVQPEAVPERRKLKAGDVVRTNSSTLYITAGKEYTVSRDEVAGQGVCISDNNDNDNGLLYGHEFTLVRAVEDAPVGDFRIRKHGARGEIRGTSYTSLQEAETAIARYMPGTIYEIVEVQVVRTVKVEQDVRVVDYKQAA
jgi:hypothetical protein